jgi:hypothetical protein
MKLRPGSGRRGLKAQNSRNQWIRNGKESWSRGTWYPSHCGLSFGKNTAWDTASGSENSCPGPLTWFHCTATSRMFRISSPSSLPSQEQPEFWDNPSWSYSEPLSMGSHLVLKNGTQEGPESSR